jgi:serine protease AprX
MTKKTFPIILIAVLLLGLLSPTASAGSGIAQAQPQLIQMAAGQPDALVRVIVQKMAGAPGVEEQVSALGGQVLQDLSIINAFSAEMTAQAAVELARSGSVRWVSLDAPMANQSQNYGPPAPTTTVPTDNFFLDSMRVRDVWNMGLDGSGIGVAVIDSGISTDTDFRTNPKVYVFATNSKSATDIYGHGTHVAGIIAGTGSDSNGRYMGVAPGVTMYAIKIADGDGMAYESDVVAGLQWVYNNKSTYNIRVVNLSLNTTTEQSYHASPLDAAVEILWFNGVVVVVSAGNVDPLSTLRLYNTSPANDPFVITVGAADEKGTASTSDDVFATYTSFGISADGNLKPNIFAPGSNIYSVLSKDSPWKTQYPDRVALNGQYIRLSGTSMSAPMVTGAVALLLQDEPNLTPDQVKYRLMNATSRSFCQKIAKTNYCLPNLDVYAAVTGTTTASANTGALPSQLLYSGTEPIAWTSVGWNSVGWNSVGWNSVGWNSVGWNSVGWNSTYWGK